MSESVTQPLPTPGAAEPGPTPGTQAPAVAEAAPAPLSSEAAPAAETVVEQAPAETVVEPPTSILSEATSTEPLVPEEPAKTEEVKAEEPKAEEAKTEDVKEAVKEPLPTPVYDAFTLPEGVTLTDDKVSAFTGLLGEAEQKIHADPAQMHAAMQEFGQKAVDLYIAEVKEATERSARFQRETWDRTIGEWQQKFRDDPEIGKNRQDTTLQRIGSLLNLYGQQMGVERETAVRDAYALTGAGNHPEVLRWANWMASRLTETPRIVTPMMPKSPTRANLTPAQRLYSKTSGAA
jgi:hypothetical protein